ncbi:trypsin-like peptidase domain-containing protein [Xenorhabdus sp. XENO-10]|uniref:Trypsin-like peptidase domain-containing protein n=1 Tax=Xenorhabdus yunnanensis TaxID=3025878 RepID=A0ABT5LCV3_9GAMM|nr:trypsin-like peptidase domain-containing protein [Xenorhabdus yunnanensis]MDC9588927.1 trypsin-like peptidase domain-containing protein [Xenorhabdus yunnanensis]
MTYRKIILISLFSVSASSSALALNTVTLSTANDNGAPLMQSTDPDAEKYRTVGKLNAYSHCTATLISGENTPNKDTPALILTAGHCVNSNVGTNDVIVDQPAPEYWQYTPDYFIDKKDELSPIKINRILYSTMKYEDIAVLQLDATYGDLAKKGYHPLKLKKNLKMKHQPIVLTHIPVDNVDYNYAYLRKSECNITGTSPLLYEGNSPWIWSPVFSTNCAGVVGGTSGSPVFEKDKTDVIGVMNTTTTPEMTGCGFGRPCTIENNKGISTEGASYFIPVDSIANALTKDNKLDLSKLENNSGNVLERSTPWSPWVTQSVNPIDGEKAKWDIVIKEGANVKNIRYKTGLISDVNCADETGYSASIPVNQSPLENILVPKQDGIYKLCVIHQNNGGQWQNTKDASVMLREIDNIPPSIKPTLNVKGLESDSWFVTTESSAYEITSIHMKHGPKATTNCDDKADYQPFWMPIVLKKAEAPWRVCAYGADMARNSGPIKVLDIEASTTK